jgi:hypothetical protein
MDSMTDGSRPPAGDDLVKVAGAQNQAEAELLQSLLSQEGVPSVLRRSAGFDVPDFLAAGPRDVLVSASQARLAREVLRVEDDVEPEPPAIRENDSSFGVLVRVLAVVAIVAILAWCITEFLA